MAQTHAGVALITGASAGIGEALAPLFAQAGYTLILVARRMDRLKQMAAKLTQAHGVEVHTLCADLALPGAAAALYARVTGLGLEVDVLVNNAGVGQYGDFVRADGAAISAMMQLNLMALVELSQLVLPGMVARGRGRVLNLGSLAGYQPGPGMAAYYASKAFVNSFSAALSEELRGSGVTVTNLSPGPVKTEFQEVAGMQRARLFSMGAQTSEAVARAGFDALMRGDALVLPGARAKLTALTAGVTPHWLQMKIVRAMNSDP